MTRRFPLYGYVLATVALLQRATPEGMKRFLRFLLVSITLVPLLLVRIAPGLRHYLAHGRWSAPGRRAHFGDA